MSDPKYKRAKSWIQKVVELAKQAAVEVPVGSSSWEIDLAQLIEEILDHGSDWIIQRARDQLSAQHEHDAAGLVEFWANEVSSCIDVQIMRDNRHACGRATVFLMPVVIAASRHDTESCLKCFNAQLAQTWPGG